jgi:hypothetical protein
MKDNNKNRKLKFIRDKNNLRIYRHRFCVSNRIDSDRLENISVDHFILEAQQKLLKKYNLKLRNHKVQIGCNNSDFIMNTKTILVTLFN